MLWIPAFIPKGCLMHPENGHTVVRCRDQAANMRAKALANLQFNWYLAAVTIFPVVLYVKMMERYGGGEKTVPYLSLNAKAEGDVEMGESAKNSPAHRRSMDGSQSSMDMDSLQPFSLER
uniref:TSA: Wollemia nobilis Ref_Wollemi_Transcript_19682_564 transcribed RNA sequence n=1 Tax=Wollemia nobilis TaxID=56998 RepID=A0A0C9S2G2_9CONI